MSEPQPASSIHPPPAGDLRHVLRTGAWIAAIAFLCGIGGGVVFPILPILGERLGLGAAMIGLILAANRITRIFFNPVTGSLLDRFGARGPVASGLFLCTLAVLAFSVALHAAMPAAWFLAGRVVWGLGSSLTLVGALAAVMQQATPAVRGRLTGRVRTASTLGLPAGMLIGGVIADAVSANAAFITAAGLTLATGLLALRVLPRTAPHAATAPADAAERIWRGLLRQPLLQVIWCTNALVFLGVSGVLLSTLVVLVHARGIHLAGLASSGSAGVLMALLMVFRALAAVFAGHRIDRQSRRTGLLLPGLLLAAAGFVVLAVAQQAWSVALALAAVGAGTGALTIPLLTLLGETAGAHVQGRAMGLYQVYGDIGGSAGPILGLQLGAWCGFAPVYLGMAAALLLALPPLYALVRRERRMHGQRG